MDHYKHPRNFGSLPGADAVVEIDNPLCGDKLKLQIKFNSCEQVEDVKFSGSGCAISTASVSLLTEYLKNKTRAELLVVDEEVVYKLLGTEINPGRVKCALLPLAGLKDILRQKEKSATSV